MADKRDYYEVLGVDRNADDAALKKAYRVLAKKSIKIPTQFFNELERTIYKFIWNNKKLGKQKLLKNKRTSGRITMPDL